MIDFSSDEESNFPSPLTPGNLVEYPPGEYPMTLVDHPGDPNLFSGQLLVLAEKLPKLVGISWLRVQFMANQTSSYPELRVALKPAVDLTLIKTSLAQENLAVEQIAAKVS